MSIQKEFTRLNLKWLAASFPLSATKINGISFKLLMFRLDPKLIHTKFADFKNKSIKVLIDYVEENRTR